MCYYVITIGKRLDDGDTEFVRTTDCKSIRSANEAIGVYLLMIDVYKPCNGFVVNIDRYSGEGYEWHYRRINIDDLTRLAEKERQNRYDNCGLGVL